MAMYGSYVSTKTTSEELKDGYIIWSPGHPNPPTVKFASRPEAIKVAHLMANKNPGQVFAVCKIVGAAAVKTVTYESFDE